MLVGGVPYRTIWSSDDASTVEVIDQTKLPHTFATARLTTLDDAARAIQDMVVRGAPLIGVTAAYGLCLALRDDPSDEGIDRAIRTLLDTRPTAVNIRWALQRIWDAISTLPESDRLDVAIRTAAVLCDADVAANRAIGEHGLAIIRAWRARRARRDDGERLNVLTHCNAGWLATVDVGTALAPVYLAHDEGVPIHVWVDETRPRNQGARLTAWELKQHGVPHTVITDNAGGHLMQRGLVDGCLVGSDRTSAGGDVCNKIGTYLKALAAFDNDVPFYAALPGSTIDWSIDDGVARIPIEERDPSEVTHASGRAKDGATVQVRLTPEGSPAANYAFDVTPARLVTGLITERGVCPASREGLEGMYPEKAAVGTGDR